MYAVPQGAGKPCSPKVLVKTWKDYSDFKMIISVQGGGLDGMNKEEEKPSTRYERLISDCF